MGNHLLGQPTGPGFVPGTATSASSATAPVQKSTTPAGDQAATPPGPGQVINPADQARTKMQPPTSNIKLAGVPGTVGGFQSGMRRTGVNV